MDTVVLSRFKALFEQQKAKLITPFGAASEALSRQDEMYDEADLTSFELESSMQIRLRNREALFLRKIDGALNRISDGSFGECEQCGQEIELRRLEARPTATHCVNCKEEQERLEQIHIDGHRHKSIGHGMKLRLA